MKIALQAPTASNGQGYHFVIVTDPEIRAELGKLTGRGRKTISLVDRAARNRGSQIGLFTNQGICAVSRGEYRQGAGARDSMLQRTSRWAPLFHSGEHLVFDHSGSLEFCSRGQSEGPGHGGDELPSRV